MSQTLLEDRHGTLHRHLHDPLCLTYKSLSRRRIGRLHYDPRATRMVSPEETGTLKSVQVRQCGSSPGVSEPEGEQSNTDSQDGNLMSARPTWRSSTMFTSG